MMQEVFGNLWDFSGTKCITTNGFVKRNGWAVMGRGCAREAAQRYPMLPLELGNFITAYGNHVYYFNKYDLYSFPVKHNWWEPADLTLIARSATDLVNMDQNVTGPIYLPRPGCGNGQLRWEDVKPIIEPIFANFNIYIVAFAHEGDGNAGVPQRTTDVVRGN